jgi:hypothetical protein
LILSGITLLFTLTSYPQADTLPGDAERQADSILDQFFKDRNVNPESEYGVDSAKLEDAESKYMDNFLQMERDKDKERLHKRILQVAIGLALLMTLFLGFRRKRLIRRDNRPPHM